MKHAAAHTKPNKTGAIIVLLTAAVLLAGVALRFFLTYSLENGILIPKRADSADLRLHALTVSDYETLARKYPEKNLRWSVPFSFGAVDSETETLTADTLSAEDEALLPFLPRLKAVSFSAADPAGALAFQERHPELTVRRSVPFGKRTLPGDLKTLAIKQERGETEALFSALPYLPDLSALTVAGEALSAEQHDALLSLHPGMELRCTLSLCGKSFSNRAAELSFAGKKLTDEALCELRAGLHRFPLVTKLDLTGCGLSEETVLSLEKELGVHIVRDMTLYGITFSSDAEEIDFSGRYIRDKGAAFEAIMPELPSLKRVIMSDCGIRNEDMDALNRRHEDVRFIWTVYFSIFSCRTDATNFICARILNNHAELYSNECAVLRYCPDLIALDLGHKNITDLSFLYDLPHLKYLILVENDIPDITPIGSLQELTYLEIFWTKEMDLTPLVNCKRLTDLNISYTWARADNAYETLMQMPQLERLWYCGNYLTEEQWADIRAVMPDCEMYLQDRGEPTGSTWREHPHYFEMRDAFEMYYMPGGTNGVDENGAQIIVG